MKFEKIRLYTPEVMKYGINTLYFIDESGNDWYDSRHLLDKKYKLAIEPSSGIIRSISKDAQNYIHWDSQCWILMESRKIVQLMAHGHILEETFQKEKSVKRKYI